METAGPWLRRTITGPPIPVLDYLVSADSSMVAMIKFELPERLKFIFHGNFIDSLYSRCAFGDSLK